MHYRHQVHLQVALALLAIFSCAVFGRIFFAPLQGDAIQAALKLTPAYAIPLALATLLVMLERAASPDAILGYRATVHRPTLRGAILQNTLEQSVLGFMSLMAFAGVAPAHLGSVLPLAAMVFVVGRIAFALGYAISPMWRFFGFSLNFYGSCALLAASLWFSMRA